MRVVSIFTILLFVAPLTTVQSVHGQDFRRKHKEFEKHIQQLQRVSKDSVGVISTPFPDRRGFQLPSSWLPVKMVNDEAVYLIKNANRFLVPNYADSSQSTYILWTSSRGKEPEIIIWSCVNGVKRAERIAEIETQNEARRVRGEKRRAEAEQNRERRKIDRQRRTNARQEERAQRAAWTRRNDAALQQERKSMFTMQQPLADAVLDRLKKTLDESLAKGSFVSSDQTLAEVRRSIVAVMAIQLQMRDVEWCNLIQQHLTPDMWSHARLDSLKSHNPEKVIVWLNREMERQVRQAEERVNYEDKMLDNEKIMDLEEAALDTAGK